MGDRKREMRWMNGWPWATADSIILLGSGLHCVGCGQGLGTTCVAMGEDWQPPGPEPEWPFGRGPRQCPVCRLREQAELAISRADALNGNDKLTARAAKLRDWIPVDRRLPTDGQLVQFWRADFKFGAGVFRARTPCPWLDRMNRVMGLFPDRLELDHVLHWKPIVGPE